MMSSDLVLLYDAPLLAIAQEYATDNKIFKSDFRDAWTKLMNSDGFENLYTDT